jgi:hypothetical protein
LFPFPCIAGLQLFLIYTILTFDQKKKKKRKRSKEELSVRAAARERNLREMLSFNLKISPPDGTLQLQSSRLQSLSSLPTYVALYRKQSESLLSLIPLKRSHEESVQVGVWFNLIFFGRVLVPSPSTQALEISVSPYLSLSPTLRDNSGDGIVSPSYFLDGSGVISFEGEAFISGVSLLNSSAFSDDINWAFDLLAGVQGPGTSKPLVLGLWRDLFPDTVALYFKSRLWVLLLMLGDGVGHHLPILPRSVYIC